MAKKFKRGERGQDKRGLSPVITTILLIALTLVIIALVFLWFRGMVTESVTKFGKNINLVCDDVDFDASYSSGMLNIINNGNVPIYRINLKIAIAGSYETKDIRELDGGSSWPDTGLAQGGTFSGDIGSSVGSASELTVLPILIGTSTKGKKTFMCGGQYGKELSL